jgi:predicted metal-dependent phosphoesterase TrpH
MPGWRIDLHVHGERSPDSTATFDGYAQRMARAGLGGIALTDHNAVPSATELSRLREKFPQSLFISGVEASAREGHVLVYGVDAAPARDIPLVELIEWARDRNAIVALAHPLRLVHGVGRHVAEGAAVDAWEGRNGRTGPDDNRWVEEAARSRGLAVLGGSDAHALRDLGRSYTELPEAPSGPEGLLEAIRRRQTVPGGRHMSALYRTSLAGRNLWLWAARGFRPV